MRLYFLVNNRRKNYNVYSYILITKHSCFEIGYGLCALIKCCIILLEKNMSVKAF